MRRDSSSSELQSSGKVALGLFFIEAACFCSCASFFSMLKDRTVSLRFKCTWNTSALGTPEPQIEQRHPRRRPRTVDDSVDHE